MQTMHRGSNCFLIGLSLLFISGKHYGLAQDFGYEGAIGPTHWGEQYNTCFGKHQSPININSLSVKPVVLRAMVFEGFDIPPDKTNITNNGHTVMVTLDAEHQPTISGGPLSGEYEFHQLHFHWGDNDTVGSEDLIDGVSFPMELHMVFYKKLYRNQRSAMEHEDGLAVLAFFFELSPKDNPHYEEFTVHLTSLTNSSSTTSFQKAPTLRELISNDLTHYYTYNGSLTTPPCSEIVTWIDFKEPIPLSHGQIEMFRALEDSHGHHLTHNFRPIQPLGDRIVLFNTNAQGDDDNTVEESPQLMNGDMSDELDVIKKHDEHLTEDPTKSTPIVDEKVKEMRNNKIDNEKKPEEVPCGASTLVHLSCINMIAIILFIC